MIIDLKDLETPNNFFLLDSLRNTLPHYRLIYHLQDSIINII